MPLRSSRKSSAVKRKKITTKKKKPARKTASRKKNGKKTVTKKKTANQKTFLSTLFDAIKKRYVFLALAGALVIYVVYLDLLVQKQFDGKRWALPAKVYARPLELYSGLRLSERDFLRELKMLGFRNKANPKNPGTYLVDGNEVVLMTRSFQFWDEKLESSVLKISFDNDVVSEIYNYTTENMVDIMRMEPAIIGGIYPTKKEDRILVKFENVPELLKTTIRIVEDRNFYEHHGLYYKGIARALWANIRAGKTVQGGSTLTQQLVKNFYLTNKRSLWRKANEAVMSLLLEYHYSKDEIFEAYINEVYLGQDKARAIHGFGLASRYYFDRNLDELEVQQIAMLVAIVKGPSYYNPRRSVKRLLKRRNLVLDLLAKFNVISSSEATAAKRKPLGIIQSKPASVSLHPAFLDLVKRQLKTFYREKDLVSEGLQIFTTLDPLIQIQAESVVKNKTRQLAKQQRLQGQLQAAVIVTNTTNSEVLALVGDSKPRQAGFNRALDAIRPIGSLIKPAIYLTALSNNRYSPLSLLTDKRVHLKGPAGDIWSPANYDKTEHGQVAFYKALSHSYNLATVRLGLELGFERIQQTIADMGIQRKIPAYPSMLLGSVNLSPYEVTQMYHSLASGGFNMPLYSIREVLALDGTPLKRFPLKVQQTLNTDNVTVINSILHNVTQEGTARSIKRLFPETFVAAGKTGTTDELRDSWFAGFSGQHLVVSWLGTDNNQPTGLTGASGALKLWTDIMRSLQTKPLSFNSSENVEYVAINPHTYKRIDNSCDNAVFLAIQTELIPAEQSGCE